MWRRRAWPDLVADWTAHSDVPFPKHFCFSFWVIELIGDTAPPCTTSPPPKKSIYRYTHLHGIGELPCLCLPEVTTACTKAMFISFDKLTLIRNRDLPTVHILEVYDVKDKN